MEKEIINLFLDKHVTLRLKNNYRANGLVADVTNHSTVLVTNDRRCAFDNFMIMSLVEIKDD